MRQEKEIEADPKRIETLIKKKSILMVGLEYFYNKINKQHKKANKKSLNKHKINR